ncbi:MAG TPA: hypothetical protein VJH03_26990 [Blastocatellia bacterium]|nr:hypothetical protein [Blastocatellia bacterium]
MTTITLEVPDELAARLDRLGDRLPDLFPELLDLLSWQKGATVPSLAEHSLRHPVFDEIIDFLASGPTREQIIAFKASEAAQRRLAELLDKNREEGLTEAESAELDVYEQVDHVMSSLKARALLAESKQSE